MTALGRDYNKTVSLEYCPMDRSYGNLVACLEVFSVAMIGDACCHNNTNFILNDATIML